MSRACLLNTMARLWAVLLRWASTKSQSRLWENHAGRSQSFWEHWHPVVLPAFCGAPQFSAAQIAAAVNRVSPSFIRVEADQVTYDLHIILRFEIELKLIEGQLAVADVPACWN